MVDRSLISKGMDRIGEWFRREGEGQHLLCWFVVFFGIGIILFFQSDGGVSPLWPLCAALICLVCTIPVRRYWRQAMHVNLALLALFSGFSVGAMRILMAETPVLHRTVIGTVEGYVETVEHRIDKPPQLVIRPRIMADLPVDQVPRRIRVTLRSGPIPEAGALVSAKMRLLPLPQPVRPSGYDFARDAYFRGLGAIGSVLGKMPVLEQTEALPFGLGLSAAVDRARNGLTRRIHDTVGGEAGGVAAALVTGKRGLIPEETNDVLRAAGIYHIVSISGLHMVIAAGIIFWIVRSLLALFPAIALRWPVKKIAAFIAMLGATGYCLFAGADIATQRALIMTLIMLGAIMVDRRALSMRNLAIAALVILVMFPEALLGPGFQMSFAAVAALITLAHVSRYFTMTARGGWFLRSVTWGANWLLALVATTLVAGLATAPFAAYHFQTAVPFGLIGNALALPLVSLIVMPMGALGALAYPFSLDQPVWQVMGWATGLVVQASHRVAALEGSLMHLPAFGGGAVLMAALALIIATVAITPLRYFAVLPLAIAVFLAASPDRYVAFVDRDGRAAAVRDTDGRLFVIGNANDFLTEQWLRADGDGRDVKAGIGKRNNRCDRNGCVGEGVITVALVKEPAAFREDCRRADVVVSRYKAPASCEARIVIDRDILFSKGAAAIHYSDDKRLSVLHARQEDAAWPWYPQRQVFR